MVVSPPDGAAERDLRALRVGVIGAGAIGSVVARQLAAGAAPGCELAGVVRREGAVDDLLTACDVVVEAAGHSALVAHAHTVLGAGIDLVICSVGALAHDELAHLVGHIGREATPGRGRLVPVSGAIGGLDILAAVRLGGTIDTVELTTTKHPTAFGMAVVERTLIFSGSARSAALRFPSTANVAATVALATVGLDRAIVHVVADPEISGSRHELSVGAELGDYHFCFDNRSAPGSSRTSAVVPWSVLTVLDSLRYSG